MQEIEKVTQNSEDMVMPFEEVTLCGSQASPDHYCLSPKTTVPGFTFFAFSHN